jgi:predicted Zn-dependent peptidase
MIDYQKFTLSNGLQVYVHEDTSTPMAILNILYNVGSRDEDESKTGFAHLFEHLMFGGSQNISSYDEPLQLVGGENNAFTSSDITNYYITLPAINLETAFWLESDRMLGLSFDPQVLEIQKKVVIEEFKQRYLNQPYGDVWLNLKPLAYQQHPYKWNTIGKEISHIENATMDDVKAFFYKFYRPNNAILVVAGNVNLNQVKKYSEKWFGDITPGPQYKRNLPREPRQMEKRIKEVSGNVPLDAIYKVFHMPGRSEDTYHIADLMSDILGRSNSSRLHERLVKEKKLFNDINSYVTGSADPGLMIISGKLNKGASIEDAERELEAIISELQLHKIDDEELFKVKNQAEATLIFGEVELLNRAMNLAYYAFLGDADMINKEADKIQSVNAEDIQAMANEILKPENSTTLYYRTV